MYTLWPRPGGPGAASPDVDKNLPASCLVRGSETGLRPNRHRVRRLDQQSERVPLRRTCGRPIRPHPVDSRQHLPVLEHRRQARRVTPGPLDLEVHQSIERNRRRYLALDERIDLADVPRHDRYEPERAVGIAPGQTAGDPELTTLADTVLDESRALAPTR